MNILKFFRRSKPAAAPAASPPPLEKRSGVRFAKTFLPSNNRATSLADGAMAGSLMGGSYGSPVAVAPPPPPEPPRAISFGTPAPAPAPAPAPVSIPPAVAVALEPRIERAIALKLADVIANIPAGVVRPLSDDEAARQILVNAAELERGMANGRPTLALTVLHRQVPEIFAGAIEKDDTRQVQLPFQVVLEQFTALQVRTDQQREQAVPQVETPFLRVTMEDNSRFGTPLEPLQTGATPPVKVEPATAHSIAAAEPEPAAAIRLDVSDFKFSPNGTDAPVTERVPASGGPSVPTSSETAPTPARARIPFKLAGTNDWLTKENFDAVAGAHPDSKDAPPGPADDAPPAEKKISLALKPILEMLPPFQVQGEIGHIPSIARVELAFSIVEPQLANGRVVITSQQFAEAMPEEYRPLLNAEAAGTVILPLHEVLKNLPAESLQIRTDQEEQEKGAEFVTPFSATAKEDAKRHKVPAVPVAKAVTAPAPPAEPVKAAPAPADEAVPAPVPSTDQKPDAKAAIARLNELKGVRACALLFGDGLTLAGALPEEVDADGLCALAPSVLQRLGDHMAGTKLGQLRSMTLECSDAALTFFMHQNLCLTAMHAESTLGAEVREELARAVQELSQKFSTPA